MGLPHNPMVNSSAILTCSLLRAHDELADRFDHVANAWRRLLASHRLGFQQLGLFVRAQNGDPDYALGYFMREHDAFPPAQIWRETLEFYFECCAIELATRAMATVAATFVNAGINPPANDPALAPNTVRYYPSLTSSCGMSNYSPSPSVCPLRAGCPAG